MIDPAFRAKSEPGAQGRLRLEMSDPPTVGGVVG
jgi:hypothetical protein